MTLLSEVLTGEVKRLEVELRAEKRSKLAMWKAMCQNCKHRQGFLCVCLNTVRPNFNNCQLLKGKK